MQIVMNNQKLPFHFLVSGISFSCLGFQFLKESTEIQNPNYANHNEQPKTPFLILGKKKNNIYVKNLKINQHNVIITL